MHSETPQLEPIVPTYHTRILSDEQLKQLQSTTLHILERVGVHCPSQKAREIYARHGAQVDPESQIVKLPPDVLMEALSHAPRFYTLGARLPDFDLELDGTAFYCGTDGTGVETIDFETRERRPSVKDDVAKSARIADALSSIGFYWPMVSAQDFPATAPLHELEAAFNNTVKHVQSETVMDEDMAHYAVEMATVIAGDEETLRQRPPLSLLVCTIAPLALDRGGMESALILAEAGLPVGFMSMANTSSTAPTTLAGMITQADAEMVAAMVLIQMAYPGTPTFHSLMPGIMHPWTGGYLCPSASVYSIGAELAHMWGVPSLTGTFGGDAPKPSWQMARMEGAGVLLATLCGSEMGNGMGLLQGSTLLYPEGLVLDSDIYHQVRINVAGLDLSPEQLALDVIAEVGPRGHFLRQTHTRDHIRELPLSELTTQPLERGGGYHDPIEVAQEKTEWILENHHPQPLEEAQRAELRRILQAAEAELGE